MRRILEELYHGNLSVTERIYRRNSAYSQAMGAMTAAEDAIRAALPEYSTAKAASQSTR